MKKKHAFSRSASMDGVTGGGRLATPQVGEGSQLAMSPLTITPQRTASR